MTFDTQPQSPEPADQDAGASARRSALRAAMGERLLVADGAMGSMLQGCPTTLDDFAGHEGCNDILNVTRPDIVRSVHDGYLDAGAYPELVEAEGRPRLCMWLERIQTDGLLDAGVVYGYFPAVSEGDDLVILDENGGDDPAGLDDIEVRYRGCRYAFGYPACPDLEDRAKVMRLLQPERIGVTLSEEFQLAPEQSTDALITHHPEANYFST